MKRKADRRDERWGTERGGIPEKGECKTETRCQQAP